MSQRRGTASKSSSTAEELLLEELKRLYEETDALQSGTSCGASTECCRFGVTGREPYVTSIEARAIAKAVAANGGPLSRKRRALPLAGSSEEERTCPLLTASGRCSVYAWRPFGCRTFFCSRATRLGGPVNRKAERELVRVLAELAARHTPDGDKVRALTQVLGESRQV